MVSRHTDDYIKLGLRTSVETRRTARTGYDFTKKVFHRRERVDFHLFNGTDAASGKNEFLVAGVRTALLIAIR